MNTNWKKLEKNMLTLTQFNWFLLSWFIISCFSFLVILFFICSPFLYHLLFFIMVYDIFVSFLFSPFRNPASTSTGTHTIAASSQSQLHYPSHSHWKFVSYYFPPHALPTSIPIVEKKNTTLQIDWTFYIISF